MEFEGSLRDIRLQKLTNYQSNNNDPFEVEGFIDRSFSNEIKESYVEDSEKEVNLAGRIMTKRLMGKAAFANIQDSKGNIQIYVRKDAIGDEAFDDFKTFDIGDIVGCKGVVFKTKTGEISVKVQSITLLTKSLQTLPEKHHGLKDTELRYRMRYVDLIVNPEIKETFIKRSKVIKMIRSYLDDRGYLEVETPILTTVAGGAAARPFLTHHNTFSLDMQLRIANELYLKRLIVGGFDKVYELGKMFRNEGISYKHNPEFTSIEIYAAYEDYTYMMDLMENLFKEVVEEVCGKLVIEYDGITIDFSKPFKRVSMHEAVKEKTGINFFEIEDLEEAKKIAKDKLNLEVKEYYTHGHLVNEAFEAYCEEDLIDPTFVMHHPVEISPLAKKNPDDNRITNRFELFINKAEYGNGYSELNNPIDQRERFESQLKQKDQGDQESHPMDEDFINALEVGMPPTAGLGIGIDRFVMLVTNSKSIKDVLFFPTMKPISSDK